jgi:WD40 repeat protein
LIALLILPYIQDRSTWNSVCRASTELSEAGKRMRPPWPTTLNVGGGAVRCVAFSPCKSFLACSLVAQNVIHVWDRHGRQARLEGPYTRGVVCLQYSSDGRYLASGSGDWSIRLWRMTSESAAYSSSSDESRNRDPDIIMLGHSTSIWALAFSPTDSNLLASGCVAGEIKLWDVISQVCIHSFHPLYSTINTIYFPPGENIHCYVVTNSGRIIRITRNKKMEFAATRLEPSLGSDPHAAFSPCGTCFASMSYMASGSKWEVALFNLRTMAKTQSFFLPGGPNDLADIAMSPDGKKVAITNNSGAAQLFECHDLTIRKSVDTLEQRSDEDEGRWPVAFDPTSRLFAVACLDGRVELRRTI